jgi:hypothetical protein
MKTTHTLPRSVALFAPTSAALRKCRRVQCRLLSVSVRRSVRLLRTGTLLLCAAFVVPASFGFEYKVSHDFSLLPNSTSADPPKPIARWNHFEQTWAIDLDTPPHDADVDPMGQPGGFDPYGTDREGRNGAVINRPRAGGAGVAVTPAAVTIPVGGAWAGLATVTSTDVAATATANARVNVTVNPGNYVAPLRGSHQVDGNGSAPGAPTCYGFSWSQVEVQGWINRGKAGWKPLIKTTAPISRCGRDPIDFAVLDTVTGDLLEGTLFDLDWTIGNGTMDWENGFMSLDAESVHITAELDSPYIPVAQRGTFDLVIEGGVVVSSSDSGVWDGQLPFVGSAGPLAFALSDNLQFDFDFGDFDGHQIDTVLRFSASGEGIDPVPEPSSISVLVIGCSLLIVRSRRIQ